MNHGSVRGERRSIRVILPSIPFWEGPAVSSVTVRERVFEPFHVYHNVADLLKQHEIIPQKGF